jgi:cobalt/nickel transport system permease protein
MGFDGWLEVGRMEELARRDTPVHRLDARAKTVTTLLFIAVVMSFPRYDVSALTPFFLYPVTLMLLGQIPAGGLLRKLLAAAPFAVAVGIFNPFFDPRTVLTIGPVPVSGGWLSFASIMTRFVLTVGAVLVLVACTGMHRLCEGLVRLGVPRLFAMQLLFLHRYLFIVADEGGRMLRGIELRSGERKALRFRVYASLVGHLLLRSMARAERVHQAMLARGFDGRPRSLVGGPRPPGATGTGARPEVGHHLYWPDLLFVCGWAVFFAAARTWNLAAAFGGLLTRGI